MMGLFETTDTALRTLDNEGKLIAMLVGAFLIMCAMILAGNVARAFEKWQERRAERAEARAKVENAHAMYRLETERLQVNPPDPMAEKARAKADVEIARIEATKLLDQRRHERYMSMVELIRETQNKISSYDRNHIKAISDLTIPERDRFFSVNTPASSTKSAHAKLNEALRIGLEELRRSLELFGDALPPEHANTDTPEQKQEEGETNNG